MSGLQIFIVPLLLGVMLYATLAALDIRALELAATVVGCFGIGAFLGFQASVGIMYALKTDLDAAPGWKVWFLLVATSVFIGTGLLYLGEALPEMRWLRGIPSVLGCFIIALALFAGVAYLLDRIQTGGPS